MPDEETGTEQTEETTDEETNAEETTTEETTTKKETVPSEYEQKLNELQSKYDSLSRDAAKDKHLLDELSPYVDYNRMQGGTTEETDESDSEFMTRAEVKAFEKRIEQKLATENFTRDFRGKHPDLGDNGPKEELVRYFFEKEKGSFDSRLESAVKAARTLLSSEQEKGATKTKAEIEKAAKEAKAKAEAAAKASGLSSAGHTTAKASDEDTEPDYAAERRATQRRKTGI